MQPAGFTLALTTQVLRQAGGSLPDDVRERARQCVLDWLGVTLAGGADHLIDLLRDEARAEGGHARATLIGHDQRVAPLQAALINGAAAHVLDYDDVNLAMHGHPSAPILAAVLALAEQTGASGAALVRAFLAGYEFACRAGAALGDHHQRGFHATATMGALGAALGCAQLLGLDATRAAHAIGIAATQAAGLKALFGTECKPLHAGMAAQHGLRAARLAAAGMVARPDALECKVGFAAAHASRFEPALGLATPGYFHLRDNLFKYHASCYGTHAPVEAARHLRQRHGLTADAIAGVVARVERGQDSVCNIAVARSGLEAKFSIRFMVAAALAGGDTADLEFFSDARTSDVALCALRDRISVEIMDGWPMLQGEVSVTLRDGRVLVARHDSDQPDPDLANQGTRLAAKFARLAAPVLGAARAGQVRHHLDQLEDLPVTTLLDACRHRH